MPRRPACGCRGPRCPRARQPPRPPSSPAPSPGASESAVGECSFASCALCRPSVFRFHRSLHQRPNAWPNAERCIHRITLQRLCLPGSIPVSGRPVNDSHASMSAGLTVHACMLALQPDQHGGRADSSSSGGELSAREAAAAARTRDCLQACHIADIFADSKFLQVRLLAARSTFIYRETVQQHMGILHHDVLRRCYQCWQHANSTDMQATCHRPFLNRPMRCWS